MSLMSLMSPDVPDVPDVPDYCPIEIYIYMYFATIASNSDISLFSCCVLLLTACDV